MTLAQLTDPVPRPGPRLRALVQGVRPSVLAAVGIDAAPFDLLDGDGITGWRLGLQCLAGGFDGTPDGSDAIALEAWVDREIDKEQFRWGNALTVVRALDTALESTPASDYGGRFIRTWSSNLRWTERRCRHGQCRLEGDVTSPATRIRSRLRGVTGSDQILRPLATIEAMPVTTLPHPWHHSDLVAEEDLDLLREWLS